MEASKAFYIVRYFGHFMTVDEHAAHKHLIATAKSMHGRTDLAAQTELRNSPRANVLRTLLSNKPEVLRLTQEGLSEFVLRTARRILDEHPDKIRFNYCSRCGTLARTPKARQCRSCGLDWHNVKF